MIGTFFTALGGVAIGIVTDFIMSKVAEVFPPLATPIYEPLRVDDIVGAGLLLVLSKFLPVGKVKTMMIVGAAFIIGKEIWEALVVHGIAPITFSPPETGV